MLNDVEDDNGTEVLFLDLKKICDTVNHSLLIKKLRMHGVDNSSFNTFGNSLSDREQTVD